MLRKPRREYQPRRGAYYWKGLIFIVTATIIPYDSDVSKGFMIVCKDNDGGVIERIAVTEVFIEGTPWPHIELEPGNKLKVVR